MKRALDTVIAFALQSRLVRSYLRYSEHRGSALADSITYRALFSVFAGVLLSFSIAALWLGGNPEAMEALEKSLATVIPGLTDVVNVAAIKAPASLTLVSAISLIGLISASISAISSLRTALRILADKLHDDKFFLWVLLRNLLVAIAFGGLLAITAALSMLSSFSIATVVSWFGGAVSEEATQWWSRSLGILIVLLIDTLAIALVFRLLSGVKAPPRALWVGALIGGIGMTVLQELSSLFVRGATSNPLLASFAALIALLLWFNLSAQVVLLASSYIITATEEARDRVREKYGASTFAQRRRLRAEDLYAAAQRGLRAAQEAEAAELAKNAKRKETTAQDETVAATSEGESKPLSGK